MNTFTLAVLLFVATYVLLLMYGKYRHWIALGSAFVFMALSIFPASKLFYVIDWNVLLMITGTMGVVHLFIESKMPSLLADLIIEKVPNVKWAIVALALFSGLISAFIDNVATVLIVAPIAILIAKKLNISPVASIISIAISANLQGAATLVGDTTSILLGGFADLNFFDFFVLNGKPSMFFFVQAGALTSILILLYLFRNETQPIHMDLRTEVKDYIPTILLVSIVVLLMIASFIPSQYQLIVFAGTPYEKSLLNGAITIGVMFVGIFIQSLRKQSLAPFNEVLQTIDWSTLLLLTSLFVIIAGISEAGIISAISELIASTTTSKNVIYTILVWGSVLISAFIDNIPYVYTMLPVVRDLGLALGLAGQPYLLYFGLLSGATLGGNITPIGASANITGLGILRKEGYEVKTWDFMRISIPFTLFAVTTAYILIWIFYH